MARSRKNLNVQNLRKQKNQNLYKDTKTGLEFSKTGNKYNMVVNKQAQKEHQANVRRLKKLNEKYGNAFYSELKRENENWNDYKQAITQFNKGEKARPSTVQRQLDYFNQKSKEQAKVLSSEKSIKSIVSDKRKVTLMRMSGKHGVYNGKAYDDYINTMSKELGTTKEETEQMIFPVGDDDKIDYDYIKTFMSGKGKQDNIFDFINQKEQSGEFSEEKSIRVKNLAMIGE